MGQDGFVIASLTRTGKNSVFEKGLPSRLWHIQIGWKFFGGGWEGGMFFSLVLFCSFGGGGGGPFHCLLTLLSSCLFSFIFSLLVCPVMVDWTLKNNFLPAFTTLWITPYEWSLTKRWGRHTPQNTCFPHLFICVPLMKHMLPSPFCKSSSYKGWFHTSFTFL